MLRTLDHRLLNSRHAYSLALRCSYTLVNRCCTVPHRTGRSSPSPCSALAVPAAKMLNPPPPPPPPLIVVLSNALRSVVKPQLPPMFMKQQPRSALPSHLLLCGGPFSARAALLPPPPSPCTATGSSRQFCTSPSSADSKGPLLQGSPPPSFSAVTASDQRPAVNQGGGGTSEASNGGSEGRFQSSDNTQKLHVMDDLELSTQKPFWHFRRRALWALYLFYMFITSVAALRIHTCPLTNRKIIFFDQLEQLGEVCKGFQETITGRETLTDDYSRKVRSILEKILSNIDKVFKHQPQCLNGIKWEIVVCKVPGVSAEAFYNGQILINPSLLQNLETDGMLAFVIGHEVAHVIAEHGNELTGNFRLGKGLIAIMSALCIVNSPQPFTFLGIPLLAIFCLFIRLVCLSQRQELEADNIGMLLSASAGYDPREAPKFFTEVARVYSSSRIPSFLRSHPPDEKRAEALLQNTKMEKALAIYKNN